MVRPDRDYSDVFSVYVPIACAVFGIILAVTLYAVIFRRRRGIPPSQKSEHTRLELTYVLILVGIAAFLTVTTFTVYARDNRATRTPGLNLNVTASQWSWRFDYPAYAITATSSAAKLATLTVPANTPVHIRLISTDVIHAFFIPTQRFKRDALPGSDNSFDLYFGKPGFIRAGGSCAEYCGLFHSNMLFDVRVLSPQAFRAWAAANRGSKEPA